MQRVLTGKTFPLIRVGAYVAGLLFFLLVPFEFLKDKSFCVFHNLFGISTPSCGMTRAVSSIFHGNLARALEYNTFVIIVFPLLGFIVLEDMVRILSRWIRQEKLMWGEKHGASLVERAIMRIYRDS